MISRPLTRQINSTEMAVAPGAVILAEGMALVRTNGNQAAGVLPSTGTATDNFVGFSFAGTSAYPFPEQYTNKVETFLVPAGGAVVLQETPLAGQFSVIDTTTGDPVTGGTLTGNTISGLTNGDTVVVTYKYAMSVVQSVALFGNVQPGGYAGAYVGQIGVILRGLVATSEFDASVDWSSVTTSKGGTLVATDIVLGANGQLTTHANSATGVAFPGMVVRTPDQLYPFLAVEFNAQA
jgi:hypothetical protein